MSVRIVLAETRPFSFPHEVVEDPSLSAAQKREILSEWASDACAVESFPTLRLLPGTSFPVTFSAIMDAREQLDRQSYAGPDDRMGQLIAVDFARREGSSRTRH
jgi:hypothetical protein